MNFYLVGVAIFAHTKNATFTYHSSQSLKKGALVRVPIGKKIANGIVIDKVYQPEFITKEVLTVLSTSLPTQLVELALWMSEHYSTHLGYILQNILPSGAQKNRRNIQHKNTAIPTRLQKQISLTAEQKKVITAVTTASEGGFLLHGAPGSGKTAAYTEMSKHTLQQGKSVILLVPEIGLTAQIIAEFSHHFKNVFVTHSQLTEAQRHNIWQKISRSNSPSIIIGPRSALFSPLSNIGLIIVDECHEQSFKQDRAPRYQALHVASKLAKLHRSKIVFGSATPNLTEIYLAMEGKLQHLQMPQPVFERTNKVHVVSRTDKSAFSRHRFLSNILLEAIEKSLASGEQALIFHNRRGSAPLVFCESCGWQTTCPTCELPLTYHGDVRQLICHTCNFTQPLLHTCPECHNPTMVYKGIGTKLIHQEITKLFPKARIARFDADNEKGQHLQERYQDIYEGKVDIIIGTQLIAKGLDLPKANTVGVLQADAGMQLPDFSSRERTFQLLYQVTGRAGRTGKAGQIIIQTFTPENQLITQAINHNFESFIEAEFKNRQKGQYPPFRYMLKLVYSAKNETTAIQNTKKAAQSIRKNFSNITVLGPAPAFHEYLRGRFHWQLTIKSKQRSKLLAIANEFNSQTHWQVDIDPMSLL